MILVKMLDVIGVSLYSSNSALNNLDVRVLGYPGEEAWGFDSNAPYQYETGGKINSVSNNYFWYSAYTYTGYSGGPIRRISDNHIVGVHYGASKDIKGKSLGVRITQYMINVIASLR